MSIIKRKLMLKFIEHPKLIYKKILESIKYFEGNLFENHQNTMLYILPADLLQIIRRELINTVGLNVAKNLLYDLNQLSADTIIQDAEDMGFKGIENVRYFFSIMALFGWGDGFNFKFDPETSTGNVILKNFPIVDQNAKFQLHYDFAGIMARMFKIVFDKDLFVEEVLCKSKGDEYCEFKIYPMREEEKQKQNLSKYKQTVAQVSKKDAKSFPPFETFDKFIDEITMDEVGVLKYKGESRLVIKDVQSINSMVYAVSSILGRKTMGAILYRCGMRTKLPFTTQVKTLDDLKDSLSKLSLFGLGIFEVINNDSQNIKIILKNSPFAIGLPTEDTPICWVMAGILHQIIQNYLDKKILSIKEVECIATGKDKCVFEINTIKS